MSEEYVYKTPSDDELKRLAAALASNTVVTSVHIFVLYEEDPEVAVANCRVVFMPLALGGGVPNEVYNEVRPIYYEYIDKAGPRSVNGLPIFMSMNVISQDDFQKLVLPRAMKIEKAMWSD